MARKIVIWAFWNAKEYGGSYYIPATHWRYIDFASSRYDDVEVILPCVTVFDEPKETKICFGNVQVVRVPLRSGYERYVLDFFLYVRLLAKIKKTTPLYIRVPDPMRWLPHVLGFRSITYHFVGNSIEVLTAEATRNWRSLLKAGLFWVEQKFLLACINSNKKARVFANGSHLSEYLSTYGVKAKAVVSSTLLVSEKVEIAPKVVGVIRLLHIGYIRSSKNLVVLLDLIGDLIEKGMAVHLDIVGDGSYRSTLEDLVRSRNINANVTFHGHIDSRVELARIIRASDIFVFPSLSEGSPRVVIEAMAFGAVVVSTRVGSLPSTFTHGAEIVFAEPTGADFAEKIIELYENQDYFNKVRVSAYERVWGNFTLDAFLSEVFPN